MSAAVAELVATCSLRDVVRWVGLEGSGLSTAGGPASGFADVLADVLADGLASALATRRVRAGQLLVRQGQPLDHFYVVGAGSFKLAHLDADGFEQITGFALRGDAIGLDACSQGRYQAHVTALEDATVVVLARWASLRVGLGEPTVLCLLQHATAAELQRRTQTQQLMAPANAEVRLARFLIHFGARQAQLGFSERRFRLPMSRRDIASFLGLAHETISRSVSLLQLAGGIVVRLREVEIVDADLLARLAHTTRGPSACSELKRRVRGQGALAA
jgi:CRP/FNR family transcriptional regulator